MWSICDGAVCVCGCLIQLLPVAHSWKLLCRTVYTTTAQYTCSDSVHLYTEPLLSSHYYFSFQFCSIAGSYRATVFTCRCHFHLYHLLLLRHLFLYLYGSNAATNATIALACMHCAMCVSATRRPHCDMRERESLLNAHIHTSLLDVHAVHLCIWLQTTWISAATALWYRRQLFFFSFFLSTILFFFWFLHDCEIRFVLHGHCACIVVVWRNMLSDTLNVEKSNYYIESQTQKAKRQM